MWLQNLAVSATEENFNWSKQDISGLVLEGDIFRLNEAWHISELHILEKKSETDDDGEIDIYKNCCWTVLLDKGYTGT